MTNTVSMTRPEVLTELGQQTLRKLMQVWFDFERRLAKTAIIQRLDLGTFALEDYQRLLLNLRPQVIEGSRWIARAASSFDHEHSDVRSVVIGHASDEHRDYEILERDYVASGGNLDEIRNRKKNIGSEALHGYLMYSASQPNPAGLLGAMWVIEGLGDKMANDWAARIDSLLDGDAKQTQFLSYHAANDDSHMDKLYGLLDRLCIDDKVAEAIVRTAEVVSRLYVMQLDEIDHAE